MITEKSVTIGNKNFKLRMDFDTIEQRIKYSEADWDGEDSRFVTMDGNETRITEEEFVAGIAQMRADLERLKNDDNFIGDIIYRIGKKKDGFFRKGAVCYAAEYPTTAYLSEEEYGYRGDCLKAKAIDAQTAEIFFTSDILYKW